MTNATLDKIAKLTDKNFHTEALIEIANAFPYLYREVKLLQTIQTIHSKDKHLTYNMAWHRSQIAESILIQIGRVEGESTLEKINSVI